MALHVQTFFACSIFLHLPTRFLLVCSSSWNIATFMKPLNLLRQILVSSVHFVSIIETITAYCNKLFVFLSLNWKFLEIPWYLQIGHKNLTQLAEEELPEKRMKSRGRVFQERMVKCVECCFVQILWVVYCCISPSFAGSQRIFEWMDAEDKLRPGKFSFARAVSQAWWQVDTNYRRMRRE